MAAAGDEIQLTWGNVTVCLDAAKSIILII